MSIEVGTDRNGCPGPTPAFVARDFTKVMTPVGWRRRDCGGSSTRDFFELLSGLPCSSASAHDRPHDGPTGADSPGYLPVTADARFAATWTAESAASGQLTVSSTMRRTHPVVSVAWECWRATGTCLGPAILSHPLVLRQTPYGPLRCNLGDS